jgi:hypothetical protein
VKEDGVSFPALMGEKPYVASILILGGEELL